jgi:hypothetical protein
MRFIKSEYPRSISESLEPASEPREGGWNPSVFMWDDE